MKLPADIKIILPPHLGQFEPSQSREGYELEKKVKNFLKTIRVKVPGFEEFDLQILAGKQFGENSDNQEALQIFMNDKECRVPLKKLPASITSNELYNLICNCLLHSNPQPDTNLALNGRDNPIIANNSTSTFPLLNVYVNWNTFQLLTTTGGNFFNKDSWEQLISLCVQGLYYELGIPVPKPTLKIYEQLNDLEFQVELTSVIFPIDKLIKVDELFVGLPMNDLGAFKEQAKEHVNPATNINQSVLTFTEDNKQALKSFLDSKRSNYWDLKGYTVLKLTSVIRNNAAVFLNQTLLNILLEKIKSNSPYLYDTFNTKISFKTLLQTLALLLDEQICILDLPGIIDCMCGIVTSTDKDDNRKIMFLPDSNYIASVPQGKGLKEMEPLDYANVARCYLRNSISYKFLKGQSTLSVVLLDQEVETYLYDSLANNQQLTADYRNSLLRNIYEEVKNIQDPIILTLQNIRWLVREIIRIEIPHVVVLAYQELSPQTNINPVARISLPSPVNNLTSSTLGG